MLSICINTCERFLNFNGEMFLFFIYNIYMHNKILLNNFGVFNSQEWAIIPKQDVLILVNNYTID
jgi:hypothetical protein